MRFAGLVFLLTLALPTAAQTEGSYPFRPGYVVTAEGDTLRGLAEDRIALERARLVRFKPTEASEPNTFSPTDLRGYGFDDGAQFVTRTVSVRPDGPVVTVLVRTLVEGPLTLYAYAHAPGDDLYYVEGEDFPLEGLYQIQSEVYRDGRYVYRTQRLYAGTLTRAFQICNEARNTASDVQYTARSLSQAIIDYNRCVEPSYTATAPSTEAGPSRFAFYPALWVGIGRDQLTTFRDYDDSALLFGAELGVSVRNSVLSNVAILLGVTYRQHDVLYNRPSETSRSALIALNLGLRYEQPLRWGNPYVGAAFILGPIVGSGEDERWIRDDAERGFALHAGLVRPVTNRVALVLGARYEQLKSFGGPLGSPSTERTGTSVYLGIRL